MRTRVDVELEKQNQKLLKSMNERTRLQLRLQTTVEGLSVAAITYYMTGLFSYLAKAGYESGMRNIDLSYITAAFIPLAALTIWLTVMEISPPTCVGAFLNRLTGFLTTTSTRSLPASSSSF